MAENPLLPHRRLQELYSLMLHCHELERRHRYAPALSREALLAATAIHMESGDLLCGESEDQVPELLVQISRGAGPGKRPADSAVQNAADLPKGSRMALCAGIAKGFQAAGSKGLVAAFASAGQREPGWDEALAYAQEARLPLLLLCADAGKRSRNQVQGETLTQPAVTRLAKRLRLQVLSVDGEDAVAMYRVVQESIVRARFGDGPAVIWCSLTSRRSSPGSASRPLAHMKEYLAARGLLPAGKRSLPRG